MTKTDTSSPPNPLHAAYYADRASVHRVRVVENVCVARDTFRVRFHCPAIAGQIVPGQFIMVRLAGLDDPLLGRPLALYDTVPDKQGRPVALDIVYQVLGKMTGRLAQCGLGDELDIWGPLGNGFPPLPAEQLIMVAGGIGVTPFLALGREYCGQRQYGAPSRRLPAAGRVTLCYGVRTADLLAGLPDFEAAGCEVRTSSDDGTAGRRGLVTDLLREVLDESRQVDRLVVCCGPEPMMKAAAEMCSQNKVRGLVSLETPMACGIGICFSCVARVRQADGGWDWKRTCVEGPVFEAADIVWR